MNEDLAVALSHIIRLRALLAACNLNKHGIPYTEDPIVDALNDTAKFLLAHQPERLKAIELNEQQYAIRHKLPNNA